MIIARCAPLVQSAESASEAACPLRSVHGLSPSKEGRGFRPTEAATHTPAGSRTPLRVDWRCGVKARLACLLFGLATYFGGHGTVGAAVPSEGTDVGGCGGLANCSFRVPDPSGYNVWGVGADMNSACQDFVQKRFNNWYPPNVWTHRVSYYVRGYSPGQWFGTWQGQGQWITGYVCQWIDSYGRPPQGDPSYAQVLRLSSTGEPAPRCPANSTYVGNGQCTCNAGYIDNPWTGASCSILQETYEAAGPQSCPTCFGNPIYPLTGVKRQVVKTGISVAGTELVLTYDSSAALRPSAAADTSLVIEPPGFGRLWKSNLHHHLKVSVGAKRALLSRGDGQVITFEGDGGGAFTPSGYNAAKLETIAGGYRLSDPATGTLEIFNSAGRSTRIESIKGQVLTFTYSGSELVRINGNDGRSIRFQYTNGLVTAVLGTDGQKTLVAYDAGKNVRSLTWSDAKARTFVYELLSLPWALTGIVDENSSRLATFGYDATGIATGTEYALSTNRYSVAHASPPAWAVSDAFDEAANTVYRVHKWEMPLGTTVTMPNGQALSVEAQKVLGVPSETSRTQPAGSGAAASAKARTYDAKGNVASVDDTTGHRTCYVHDSKNREIVRVEGFSLSSSCASMTGAGAVLPTGARKITTDWHADWRLPTSKVEPLRTTIYVYNGQPDPSNANALANCTPAPAMADGKPLPLLCKQVEQATGGPTRTTRFTYDGAGRVLSSIDPNGQTTTFSYYNQTSFSGGPYDPYIDNVVLLLHGNGPDGSTSVIDDSIAQNAVSSVGNTKISAAQARLGNTSIAFDGTGDYLLVPARDEFNLGAGDFTIETFFYKNANNSAYGSRLWNPNGDIYDGAALFIDGSGYLGAFISTNGTSWTHSLPTIANLANGRWYHVALVRNGGNVYAFLDGVRYTVTTSLGTAGLYAATAPRVIGGQAGTNRALNGYIDEFRITKGVARYVTSFVPPTQEFPHGMPDATVTGHAAGDLASITNAAGHATHLDAYDPAGRVRQLTDAKGVITTITYTARGWISTLSVAVAGGAARTTTYTYDGVGQLTGVSMPDSASLIYSYDAAHRLVGAMDSRGNSVTYTLDNEGKRIAEAVRDPTGALQRSIARSFDALGRLQQVVGAQQ
jgi:YD repeat-containing protein